MLNFVMLNAVGLKSILIVVVRREGFKGSANSEDIESYHRY